jgi:hypothetical protein
MRTSDEPVDSWWARFECDQKQAIRALLRMIGEANDKQVVKTPRHESQLNVKVTERQIYQYGCN